MTNSIIEAISIALNAEFDGKCKAHMEEIKQGLKPPCFFIVSLSPTNELFLGKRYFKSNPFCIQYFPESAKKQRECNAVAERMNWCLEYITVDGDKCRGTKMHHEVVDGVLNFFVNYDFFVYKHEVSEAMGEMESHNNVKGSE